MLQYFETELQFYNFLLWSWIALGIVTFFALFFITAPYGRHSSKSGWLINNRVGWIIMEGLSPIIFFICFVYRTIPDEQNIIGFALWELHYVNRAFIYPLRLHSSANMAPSVILSAIFFNLINPYLNARCIFTLCTPTPLSVTRLLLGLGLFFTGMNINQNSDNILLQLRKQSEQDKAKTDGKTKYKIPTGGLYDYISSANYFGEIVEWLGFYIITWNVGSLSFFIWTFCNLVPRGYANHLWYLKTFPDYPKNRKAIIPFVF